MDEERDDEARTVRRVRAVVRGRVQGVWFRETARRVAEGAGATGWVSNEADGTVLVEVQGPARAVEEVVRFLEAGPERADVAAVDVAEVAVVPAEAGFAVR